MATTLPTYTGELTSLVAFTGIQPVDSLLAGSKWGTGSAGTPASVTFSFPASVGAFDTQPGLAGNYGDGDPLGLGFGSRLAGFSPFTAAQQEAARQVLQAFSDVANLNFIEVPAATVDAGVLRFANSAPPGLTATTWGVSWFPQDLAGSGDTWMNSAFVFPEGWAPGTQNFLTLLHEVGHALGLKHPHDRGPSGVLTGWPENTAVLPFTGIDTLATESTQTMVMAYNDIAGLSTLGDLALQSDYAPTTPMRWDIVALQYLYGPNTAYNAGDTVYAFDGDSRYNQTIWDGGGIDSIVAIGSRGVEIDLRPAQWSKLGQPMSFSTRNPDNSLNAAQPQFNDPYTVFIYDTVTIENATGGAGNDVIIGNEVDNLLRGSEGNDTIEGGPGSDTAVYVGAIAGSTIHRTTQGVTVSSAAEGTDAVANVEALRFSDMSVNLLVQARAASAPAADVTRMIELYIAFFNRVPDADGLNYWIGERVAGQSVNQIAESFYTAGAQYTSLTGFSTGMSNADFVNVVYRNVLGRQEGADAGGLAYWGGELASGRASRGELVSTILNSAHTFKGDATWGWVADLLDNKIAVGRTFAVNWGLNYNTPAESIAKGMAIAAAITPTSTDMAIALVGVDPAKLDLVSAAA